MIQTLEHLKLRVIFVTVPTHDTAVQSSPTCLLQCHRTLLNANVVQSLARVIVRCWIGFEFIQNFNHATLFNIVGPFNPIVGSTICGGSQHKTWFTYACAIIVYMQLLMHTFFYELVS
jgi:hypothetical protein